MFEYRNTFFNLSYLWTHIHHKKSKILGKLWSKNIKMDFIIRKIFIKFIELNPLSSGVFTNIIILNLTLN